MAVPTAPTGFTIGGKYKVIRLLGKGGMGAVYEAENTWTRRRVAIKVMRPEVAAVEVYAQRFMREAQAATRLAHPNIVDVLDMGRDETLDALYIVQEFLVGHDLRAHLDAAGRLSPTDALTLIIPVMEALVTAHAQGIVHRDIKPDNIFLAETPRGVVPKLIDFGIAKVADADGDGMQKTQTGMLVGTPYYMSPEQAEGKSDLDARSDVWSLGVVLYTMLAGTRPYEATNGNALMAKIIYEDPIPLMNAATDLPPWLVRVVMGALRRNRDERYPTMQAFLDAVRADAAGDIAPGPAPSRAAVALPPTERPSGLAASTLAPPQDRADGTLAPHTATVTPSSVRTRRGLVGAGIGLLGAGSLALWLVVTHGHGASPITPPATPPLTAAMVSATPSRPAARPVAPALAPAAPAAPRVPSVALPVAPAVPAVVLPPAPPAAGSRRAQGHHHGRMSSPAEEPMAARRVSAPDPQPGVPTVRVAPPTAVGPTGVPILSGD